MNPTAQTYTTPPAQGGVQADQIQNMADQIAQGYKNVPTVQQSMATAAAAADNVTAPVAQDRGALIDQLFQHDQELNKRYSDPSSDMYMLNPLDRERAINGATTPTWGAISDLSALLGQRRAAVGNTVDKGMQAYNAGLQGQKMNLDTLMSLYNTQNQQKSDKLSKILQTLGITGGTLPDWVADELGMKKGTYIPSEIERSRATSQQGIQEGRIASLKQEAKSGALLKDLFAKYGGLLDANDILQTYNANSKWGPAKESPEQLSKLYGVDPTKFDLKKQLTPSEQIKVQTMQDEAQGKLSDIDRAIQLLNSGKVSTGTGTKQRYAMSDLPGVGGMFVSPEEREFKTIVGRLGSEEMFKFGGKRLTGPEIATLNQFLPNVDNSSENLKTNLTKLKDKLNTTYGAYLNMASGLQGGSTADPLGIR